MTDPYLLIAIIAFVLAMAGVVYGLKSRNLSLGWRFVLFGAVFVLIAPGFFLLFAGFFARFG